RRVDGRGRSSHAKRARSNAGGCSETARRTSDGSRHPSVAFCSGGRHDQGAGSDGRRRRPLGGSHPRGIAGRRVRR
ncbi:hypothetical protein L210DRAFT_3524356, partial [Boletus edulis BED1]